MSKQINFFKGHPTLSLLPNDEIASAFREVLSASSDAENIPYERSPLEYGTDAGNIETRKAILEWSNKKYGRGPGNPDLVNLTAGASYGVANILAACTHPDVTKHVFVVSPTYFLINYVFVDANFGGKVSAIVETPHDEYEVDVKALESQLEELDRRANLEPVASEEINVVHDPTWRGDRKFYRYLMYMVPTFSNPGGLCYSEKTRLKLLSIARKHDVLLISDDVYDFLSYDASAPVIHKVNHLDEDSLPKGWRFGNSVSNASFSKLIAPGLRTGWQETAGVALARQLATTGANKSGGTPSQLNISVVQKFIETGALDKGISKFISVYKRRASVMISAMKEHLPTKYMDIEGGNGGYFIWCTISAPGVDLAKVLKKLEDEYDVIIPEGSHFEVVGDNKGFGSRCARLSVAYLEEEQIKVGIEKWGIVMRQEYPNLY